MWLLVLLGAVLAVGVAVALVVGRPRDGRALERLVLAVVVLGALGATLAVVQAVGAA